MNANVLRGAALVAAACAGAAMAQSRTEQARQAGVELGPSPACALLSKDEVAKITGRRLYLDSGTGAKLANGGSSCNYEIVGVTLFSGPKSDEHHENLVKIFKQEKTPRQPLSGIGERAYLMEIKAQRSYQSDHGVLVVRQGQHTLQVSLEAERGETVQALQPKLMALAKTALAKLR